MATPPPPQPPPPPPSPPPPQPPAPPEHPPVDPDPGRIRPSRLWYWVAGAIAVAAIAGSVLVFTGGDEDDEGLGSLTDVLTTLERLEAPGAITVDLEAGTEWSIYGLTNDRSGRFGTDPADALGLRCRVAEPDGEVLPLDSDLGIGTVTLGADVYETAFTFDVRESGPHEVACRTRGGRPLSLLVGESVDLGEVFGFVGRVALGIAILLLGVIVTIAIALPVWLSRSRKIAEARRAGAAL